MKLVGDLHALPSAGFWLEICGMMVRGRKVYGVKDKGFHSYGHLLHQRLSRSELSMIPNVKHQIPTKASNKVNDQIQQFVKAHETPPN